MAKTRGFRGTVFGSLALGAAAGIAFGVLALAPNLPGGANQVSQSLQAERDEALHQVEVAKAQVVTADNFVELLSAKALDGALADTSVMVLRTADSEDADVEALQADLKRAGATDSGVITLTEKFFDQDYADSLKNIVSNTLPAGATLSEEQFDAGTHAGELMGSVLLETPDGQSASPADRSLALGALQEAGFISYQEGTILPAKVAVLVLGDSNSATAEDEFAAAFDSRGGGLVVAGRIHTAADTGAIGLIRADAAKRGAVSTVDSVDQTWARIVVVRAAADQLRGTSGSYGAAANADAAGPAM